MLLKVVKRCFLLTFFMLLISFALTLSLQACTKYCVIPEVNKDVQINTIMPESFMNCPRCYRRVQIAFYFVGYTTNPSICGLARLYRRVWRCPYCDRITVSENISGPSCSWGSTHAPHGFCQQNCVRCGRARSVPCTWTPSGSNCTICNMITVRATKYE